MSDSVLLTVTSQLIAALIEQTYCMYAAETRGKNTEAMAQKLNFAMHYVN